MEKLGPDILRKYANDLEDKRQLVNVEMCRRCEGLDQHMLLALNGATGERSGHKNLDAGAITGWLKKRLLEVSTPDKQDNVVLGLFYTTIDPLKLEPNDSIMRRPNVAIGVFPLYNREVDYVIRPREIDVDRWKANGRAEMIHESLTKDDPLLVTDLKGPKFIYYKKSPFGPDHPYKIDWSKRAYDRILYPEPCDLSLEENLINHALWRSHHSSEEPELFKKTGFAKFIKNHCSDPKYIELHAAFTQSRLKK